MHATPKSASGALCWRLWHSLLSGCKPGGNVCLQPDRCVSTRLVGSRENRDAWLYRASEEAEMGLKTGHARRRGAGAPSTGKSGMR